MEIKKDEFGPEHVVKVYDSKIGMEGLLVIDNTVLGPGKGGIRMSAGLTELELFRLARTMTWKNSLYGLPFGGAKAGIIWKGGPENLKKQFVQSFARLIKHFIPGKYIAGPDVNTGEKEMAWFAKSAGSWKSATGKPKSLCMKIFGKPGEKCGIPHEYGSTGWGVAWASKTAADFLGIDIKKIRVAIHGFGNVGTFTWKFLSQMGVKITALADSSASVLDGEGLDAKILNSIINGKKGLNSYPARKRISSKDFWGLPVDILIPASVTDVINDRNKNAIQARVIVEAGNIPMREGIENEFFKKGVVILPDFAVNGGGVISSFAEYRGYNPKQMFDTVYKRITGVISEILEKSLAGKNTPRQIAMFMARKRILNKMKTI